MRNLEKQRTEKLFNSFDHQKSSEEMRRRFSKGEEWTKYDLMVVFNISESSALLIIKEWEKDGIITTRIENENTFCQFPLFIKTIPTIELSKDDDLILNFLKEHKGKRFSASVFAKSLNKDVRTINHLLKNLVAKGLIKSNLPPYKYWEYWIED